MHKLQNDLHTGDPKKCPLCGPDYINNKDMIERPHQCNLKNKDEKYPYVEPRLDITPQRSIFPIVNHSNATYNTEDMIEESDTNEEGEDTFQDNFE